MNCRNWLYQIFYWLTAIWCGVGFDGGLPCWLVTPIAILSLVMAILYLRQACREYRAEQWAGKALVMELKGRRLAWLRISRESWATASERAGQANHKTNKSYATDREQQSRGVAFIVVMLLIVLAVPEVIYFAGYLICQMVNHIFNR